MDCRHGESPVALLLSYLVKVRRVQRCSQILCSNDLQRDFALKSPSPWATWQLFFQNGLKLQRSVHGGHILMWQERRFLQQVACHWIPINKIVIAGGAADTTKDILTIMLPNWGSIGPRTSRYCASKELFITLSWLKEWVKTMRKTKAWLYKLLTSYKNRTRHNWSRVPSSPSSAKKKSALVCTQTLGKWLPANLHKENRQPKSALIDSRYVCISLLSMARVGFFPFSHTRDWIVVSFFLCCLFFLALGSNSNTYHSSTPSVQCSAHADNTGKIWHIQTWGFFTMDWYCSSADGLILSFCGTHGW